MTTKSTIRIKGWCALCRSRCGCVSVVEDGRLVAVEPDRTHPTGQSLCAKGQAAPELVYNEERALFPLKRTRPKGDADPGWQRISWDEALDTIAAKMRVAAAEDGPASVAFAVTTGSGTAISDNGHYIERLLRAFGSSNNCYGVEICNWHKDHATAYTFGCGIGTPDIDNAGAMLLWGHNPNVSWLAQGQRVARARRRGMKTLVVDPRKAGPAVKADAWLRVRPGTDGALALSLAHVLLESQSFDVEFVRRWTNGPALVHPDEGRLLTVADLEAERGPDDYRGDTSDESPDSGLGWDEGAGRARALGHATAEPAFAPTLFGEFPVATTDGLLTCKTVLSHYREACADYPPDVAEAITGVPADGIREAAALLWSSRPVSYYAWSGVGQHTNATQTDRAISVLYTLLGSIGDKGGNMQFASLPVGDISGAGLVTEEMRERTLGLDARPLGPPRSGWCTSEDLYRSILDGEPYRTRVLLGFGANMVMSHAGVARGVEALSALDFQVHADLYLNPTAQFADIFLPVNSPWERDAVRVGFEVTQAANGLVQHRPAAVPSRGEARDDAQIVFELAQRLGLGDAFWGGSKEAAVRSWLAPAGIDYDDLIAAPGGIAVEMEPAFGAYRTTGFNTPTGRIQIWSDTFGQHGYPPLPDYHPPAWSAARMPEVAARYPLILTSTKSAQYCHSQHRNLARLRKRATDPEIEIHPDTAQARQIADGDWVRIATPSGQVRARARYRPHLAPEVVVGEHGWWQGCSALGLDGFPAIGDGTANFNLLIDDTYADPISGSTPHRSYLCEVSPLLDANQGL